jgi:16S rRNA processing protein RimM
MRPESRPIPNLGPGALAGPSQTHAGKHMTVSAESWVLLAHIVRPQGRHGEVLADLFTDFPQHFPRRKRLFLRPPGGRQPEAMREAKVESHWLHKGRVVLKLSQVDSIADAETLLGVDVVVPRAERIPLEDDAVYMSDLLGVRVIDVSRGGATDAGEITDVEPEGAGPAMLVIRTPRGDELLIPFVRAYLRKMDIEGKRLEMDLPQGLLTVQESSESE